MLIILYFYLVAHNFNNIDIKLVQQDLIGNLVTKLITFTVCDNRFCDITCIQN